MLEQSTTDSENVQITPSNDVLGAEITGVDVAAGIDETTLMTVRDAVLRHSLVVFRDQHLSPGEQLAFTNRMAEVRLTPRPADGAHATIVPDYPQLIVVSNIVENGHPIGISDAGLLWHSDTCFQTNPELFITLCALEIPERDGIALGDTRYASTPAAYDALDDATKQRIDKLRVVQSYIYHMDKLERLGLLTRPHLTEKQRRNTVEVSHPLVRTHPITGRKLLYINEAFSDRIEGMPYDESRKLLDELLAHITREDFTTLHHWRAGDLLIWDNCATQHLATFDYGTIPRRLHRCGTVGPVPV
jgi:taurine dioxygenase